MRVCIIGGGLFGCTAATHAAREGHDVHLFEASDYIMMAASRINQFRMHRGYHYPRSPETALECQAGMADFIAEYGDAVIEGDQHIYAIAREGSKTTPEQFLAFCSRMDLPYKVLLATPELDMDEVGLAVEVTEARIDPVKLRALALEGLMRSGVKLHTGTPASMSLRDRFDRIVIACYAGTNHVAATLGCPVTEFQFEVVEKPVVEMPPEIAGLSLVVMDGPFCSMDPLGHGPEHVLGHVEHCLHSVNTGVFPKIPGYLADHLNKAVRHVEGSRVNAFLEAAGRFVPAIRDARPLGSLYTIRAVLPHRDATDERPTLVSVLDEQVIRVFSGKLGTAVTAARSVASSLDRTDARVSEAA